MERQQELERVEPEREKEEPKAELKEHESQDKKDIINQGEATRDVEEFQKKLAKNGFAVFDLNEDLKLDEQGPVDWQKIAQELPWKLLPNARASLAPTKIQMKVMEENGQVQAVTFNEKEQAQGTRHLKHGTKENNLSKTTNLTLDPCHADGAKAFGDQLPGYIFLLCEHECDQGGENFIVDGEKVIQDFAQGSNEKEKFLFDTPVQQIYYSVTATGKGVHQGPLAKRIKMDGKERVIASCPNVFESNESERVRPIDTDNMHHVDMISKYAACMRKAQNDAPRFKLKAGQVLCCDNYRVWHGREAYFDLKRTLWRVWCWTHDCDLPSDVPCGKNEKGDHQM